MGKVGRRRLKFVMAHNGGHIECEEYLMEETGGFLNIKSVGNEK